MSCLELLCKMLVSVVMWHFPSLFRQKKLVSSPEQPVGPSQMSDSAVCYLPFPSWSRISASLPLCLSSSPSALVWGWDPQLLQWACSGKEQNNERVKTSKARFPQMHLGAYTYELDGLFWDIITFSFEVLRRDRLDPVCDSALDPDMCLRLSLSGYYT